jgi:hypothetical protein
MKKVYNIDLPTGERISIDYNSRAFSEDSVCLHLEFHGKAISETGYRSHFFGGMNGYEPTFEEVEKLIYKLIEEWTDIRFDKPTQVKLFP